MKSFKYKLKPSVRIAARFGQWLRICRELSQAGLHESREACRLQRFSLNYLTQAAEPPEAKAGREDVERARGKAQVLQDVLPRLGKALLSQNFRVTIENRPAERFPEKPEEPQSVHSRTAWWPAAIKKSAGPMMRPKSGRNHLKAMHDQMLSFGSIAPKYGKGLMGL